RLERAIGVESALMSSSVRNLKIRCKVDDQPGGQHEGIDYYEGLSICMSKDPRAFEIQMRYQTTVRRELTQMLAQLERIRRNPLPAGSEPLNLPPVEPGDVIEIPTAASCAAVPAETRGAAPAEPPPSSQPADAQAAATPPSAPVCSPQSVDTAPLTAKIGFVSQSSAPAASGPAPVPTDHPRGCAAFGAESRGTSGCIHFQGGVQHPAESAALSPAAKMD
ncbi:MAG: hypothetical protein HYS04_12695, partial [Acidobacteria bacterium]|nr:hypothetical protein [Acidobacteriota bacterium]